MDADAYSASAHISDAVVAGRRGGDRFGSVGVLLARVVNPLYLDLNMLARLPYLRRSTEGVVNAATANSSNSTDCWQDGPAFGQRDIPEGWIHGIHLENRTASRVTMSAVTKGGRLNGRAPAVG